MSIFTPSRSRLRFSKTSILAPVGITVILLSVNSIFPMNKTRSRFPKIRLPDSTTLNGHRYSHDHYDKKCRREVYSSRKSKEHTGNEQLSSVRSYCFTLWTFYDPQKLCDAEAVIGGFE